MVEYYGIRAEDPCYNTIDEMAGSKMTDPTRGNWCASRDHLDKTRGDFKSFFRGTTWLPAAPGRPEQSLPSQKFDDHLCPKDRAARARAVSYVLKQKF